MNVDRAILAFGGTMVLLSALLTALMSPWWLLLTAFVGLNLLQSSVTGFCPVATMLGKFGVPAGRAFDVPGSAEVNSAPVEVVSSAK